MTFSSREKQQVKALVKHFELSLSDIELFVKQVRGRIVASKELFKLIHSVKWRIKDPSHLKDKLFRYILRARAKKEPFDITPDNLFIKINDLGGVRLLHLHTRQFGDIHRELSSALLEEQLVVIEGPTARTWDDETRAYFNSIGVQTQDSKSLYTSVHYLIESNSRTKYTCEIQVRTLAEELWGEVSHSFNYPRPTRSIACNEQVKVLARITSGCSRLVDSVFKSRDEYLRQIARGNLKRRNKDVKKQ